MKPGRKAQTREQRIATFWSRVDVRGPDECWLWRGAKVKGYGVFWFEGRNQLAHRLAHRLESGPIPAGMLICHRCDVPGCCNPSHLYAGTNDDNMRDMFRRQRGQGPHRTPRLIHEGVLRDSMTLLEWCAQSGRGSISWLHYEAGVSLPTLYKARGGAPVSERCAQAISEATRGAVSADSLVRGRRAS